MTKRWFLSDAVAAIFVCILVIILLDLFTSEQSVVVPAAGVIWALCGIALTGYCSKNWRKVIRRTGYFPLAFGASSILFGLVVALAPTNLMIDIVLLAFLAIICMSVIAVAAWLARLLKREAWT